METILVIDDNESMRETINIYLSGLECRVILASDGFEGLEIVKKEHPDLVITDLRMPDMSGLEVLKKSKEIDNNIQILIITAFEDFQTAMKSMQLEAYDYLKKPVDLEKFLETVKAALKLRTLNEFPGIDINTDSDEYQIGSKLVGNNPLMLELFKKMGKISNNKVSVLVQGESGTGKELVTKVIHYSGITKNYPFIAVNCTALSQSLLESELFGHVRGAFTGAIKDKKGKFELAGEGTIFLDEISEISHSIQVKLLRVLQEKEYEKVGGEVTIPMKARIVAATNKNLAELVEKGKFREDLYYRLKVVTLDIPPLRERKDDIPNLVVNLLIKINKELHKNIHKIPFTVMERLINYDWIGNVRELENTLLQAAVLAKGEVLEDQYILLGNSNNIDYNLHAKSTMSLDEIEKEHIKLVLDSVKWNKQQACRILGITKPTLNSRIEQFSISANCK